MTHVILLNGGPHFPASRLLDVLHEAGITTTVVTPSSTTATTIGIAATLAAGKPHLAQVDRSRAENAAGASPSSSSSSSSPAPSPLAVLYGVLETSDVAELRGVVKSATARWPTAHLVACRHATSQQGQQRQKSPADSRRLGAATLKRLGFTTVVDKPAQLPRLLRQLTARSMLKVTGDEALPLEEELANKSLSVAPTSVLLPDKLTTRTVRVAFELIASLHFAKDQRSTAQTALAGLALLMHADRWTIYLASKAVSTGGIAITVSDAKEAGLELLAVRGSLPSEREQAPDTDWHLLIGDPQVLLETQSNATRQALETGETKRETRAGRCFLSAPLINGEKILGVIEATREGTAKKRPRVFAAAEATLLDALAVPLAAALANSVRLAEAERLSQTDDLTKLHNARFLRQYVLSEVKRARRYRSPVAAVFLDIDDFKGINDEHGHLVGSHVLTEMASVILSSVRDTDVVTRYGGDEFVIVLPETAVEQAVRVAERVRERIAGYVFTGGRSLRLQLTASFGVATFPQHASSPQQLIACADTAMYEAKAARKNCTRSASKPV